MSTDAKTLLAIDPGNIESAWMLFRGDAPIAFGKEQNHVLLDRIERLFHGISAPGAEHLAIEMIQSFGMAVGKEVFDTVLWTGRFVQETHPAPHTLVYRGDVKQHLCHSAKAKDGNIRQALIDRFGGEDKAIGGVKCKHCGGKGWRGAGRPVCEVCNGSKWKHPPGPLHGISADVWSALAIAVTWWDKNSSV